MLNCAGKVKSRSVCVWTYSSESASSTRKEKVPKRLVSAQRSFNTLQNFLKTRRVHTQRNPTCVEFGRLYKRFLSELWRTRKCFKHLHTNMFTTPSSCHHTDRMAKQTWFTSNTPTQYAKQSKFVSSHRQKAERFNCSLWCLNHQASRSVSTQTCFDPRSFPRRAYQVLPA